MKNTIYLIIILLCFNACSGGEYATRAKRASLKTRNPNVYNSYAMADKDRFTIAETKIIYSAMLEIRVKNPDSALVQVKRIAISNGGYMKEIGTIRSVIRVKSANLANALTQLGQLGRVTEKMQYGDDVTDEYRDNQIRLENAEKARTRYLELLSKAENVQTAIGVEKELERLNETIEILKGKLNRVDHLAEYATITVVLKERIKPGPIGYVFVGLWYSIKWIFVRN